MARVPNRGKASSPKEIDLGFLDGVQVSRESDLENLTRNLIKNPEAVAPMRWIVEQWGPENTRVWWWGDTKRGLPDYDYMEPCSVYRLPRSFDFSAASVDRRHRFRKALVRRFPDAERHFRVLP